MGINLITIENEILKLGFKESGKGALYSIVDLKSGFDFIREKKLLKDLFRISLKCRDTREVEEIGSCSAEIFEWQKKENKSDKKLILEYSFLSKNKLKVIVEIRLDNNLNLSKWRFKIDNLDNKKIFYSIACPIIPAISKLGEKVAGESIALSKNGEGYLFRDPYPLLNGHPLKIGEELDDSITGVGEVHNVYPGNQCMQFVLCFNNEAGLYMATHDNSQNVKSFDLGEMKDLGANPVLSISHFLEEKDGEDISIEYDTVLGVFNGDWYDGARIYKNWATKQWWCEKKLWDKDISEWIRDGFGIFSMSNYNTDNHNLNHPLNEIVNVTNELSKEIGSPLLSLIFNFESGGAWTGPIGFFPPREGEDEFKKAMHNLNKAGNYGFIYLLLDAWYLRVPFTDSEPFNSWAVFEAEAKDNAVLSDSVEIEMHNPFPSEWKITRMCPYTEYTRKLVTKLIIQALKLGTSVIQLDSFPLGSAQACYDHSHGHPLGYGKWWSEKCNNIIEDVRKSAKAIKSDFAISTEGVCENFIRYLDFYDNRNSVIEYFGHLEKDLPMGIETIPLFNFIYHEYIGSYTAFAPEFSLSEDLDLYWTRCLGKSLAEGVVPNGGLFVPDSKKLNRIVADFYKKVVRASTNECWKYLMFGEMLKPPEINVPIITIPYSRLIPPGVVEDKIRKLKDKAIQYGVWKARDGSIAYFFINTSKEKVKFRVDLSGYCGNSCYDIDFILNGNRQKYKKDFLVSKQAEHDIETEPLSVIVVEIYPGEKL